MLSSCRHFRLYENECHLANLNATSGFYETYSCQGSVASTFHNLYKWSTSYLDSSIVYILTPTTIRMIMNPSNNSLPPPIIKWNTVFKPLIDTTEILWMSNVHFQQIWWYILRNYFVFLPCLASRDTIITTLHETWMQVVLGESNNLILLNSSTKVAAFPNEVFCSPVRQRNDILFIVVCYKFTKYVKIIQHQLQSILPSFIV